MKPAKQSARFILLMLLASLVYLGFEIHFNAQLLEVSSSFNAAKDKVNDVETFGRIMSGIGLSLILIGIFFNKTLKSKFVFSKHLEDKNALNRLSRDGQKRSVKAVPLLISRIISAGLVIVALAASRSDTLNSQEAYLLLAFSLASLFISLYFSKNIRLITLLSLVAGFCLMFFGQKVAIDTYIEHSSTEARTNAYYMYLLKKGLHQDVLEIEGLPFNSKNTDDPVTMTFLSLMGGLVSSSPAFLDVIAGEKHNIIKSTVAKNSSKRLKPAYAAYKKAGNEIANKWDLYKQKSAELSRSGDKASAQKAFLELLSERDKIHGQFKRSYEKYIKAAKQEAEGMMPSLHDYHRRISSCSSASCQDRHYKPFASQIQKQFGQKVDRFYFCVDVKENVVTSLLNKFDGLLGGNNQVNHFNCHASYVTTAFVTSRIQTLRDGDFEMKSGYPISLVSQKAQFLTHPKTIASLRDKIIKQGIKVSSTWDHTKRDEFISAYMAYSIDSASSRWDKAMQKALGAKMPSMLSYKQFIQHDAVQNKIKKAMGSNYIKNMSMEMSEKEFHELVLKPQLIKKVNKEVERLQYESQEFASGGEREAEGKAMLRSVIVPPIALFISLLMTIITVGKNGIAFSGLLMRSPGLRKLPASVTVFSKWAFTTATALVIFVIPFTVSNSFADSKAFKYFLDEYKQVSPVWSYTTEWVMRMEPLIYPIDSKVPLALEQLKDKVDKMDIYKKIRGDSTRARNQG